MLGGFKGFFANQGLGPDFSELAAWAKRRGHSFKRERDGHGFVVDGKLEGQVWRLEWGPPQRPYIQGHELRLRMDLGLPVDLQMIVMSRPLMEQLEKDVFEQFTKSNQTEMGDAAPEEMRWLVMFPKISLASSKLLRSSFGGVSSQPDDGPAWLEGPLAHALERASGLLLRLQPPMVLMTLRGRIYLRMQLPSADETDVSAALGLFETAGTEAMRVARTRVSDASEGTASTFSTAWQALNPVRRK
jgi:hypothetical protein